MSDYPTICDWIENEWHYHALVIGIDDSVFWHLTPKTIQVYFKAYEKRRKIEIQDLWLQGRYFACAIASTLSFSKSKPPDYPEMPYQDEEEQEQKHSDDWMRMMRDARRNQLKRFLETNKKNK